MLGAVPSHRTDVVARPGAAASIAIVAWLLTDRMRRIERRLDRTDAFAVERRLELIRSSAPAPRASFGWLTRTDRTGVFIPVLLGAGAVMSAIAWVVERLARATAGRSAERGLASKLGAIEPPAGSLLDTGHDPLALLRGPAR